MKSAVFWFFVVLVSCFCGTLGAAPAPVPPPGPREIDFSSLNGDKDGRYKLTVSVTAGENKYRMTFDIDGRSTGTAVTDLVHLSMQNSGWKVRIEKGAKLVITGKDDDLTSGCTIQSENLEAAFLPKVRPVKK